VPFVGVPCGIFNLLVIKGLVLRARKKDQSVGQVLRIFTLLREFSPTAHLALRNFSQFGLSFAYSLVGEVGSSSSECDSPNFFIL